jgi:prefoldin beta subunit
MDPQMSKQLQDKLAQFQTLQSQMQLVTMQKQQIFLQSADIDAALEALSAATGEKVYKVAGPLLVESSKDASEKKLKEDKELSEARIKMLEKQEKKMSEKMEELRSEVQGMVKQPPVGN